MAFINSSLDELVFFELPNRELAAELLADLAPKRFAWIHTGDDGAVGAALLDPDQLDLAALLRGVQRWLSWRSIVAIRFEVDGRIYVLDSARTLVRA